MRLHTLQASRLLCFVCASFLFVNLGLAQELNFEDQDQIVCKEADALALGFEGMFVSNPLTADYDLKYYRFEWYIDPAEYFITGKATVYFSTLADDFSAVNFDFSSVLSIDSIRYHGQDAGFTQSGDYLLTIQLPAPLTNGTLDSLTIAYSGAPPSGGFGSFIQSTHAGTPILWTLSEPFGAQDWWPCKNGLTDKIDSIDVIISTPSEYRAASNGRLIDEFTSGTNKVYHWQHRHAIAPYLVAIAVTNYVQYTDTVALGNGTKMPMLNYVYPENLDAAQSGTADLVQVLEFYDSLFVAYPYFDEKYGHAQFGWGGGMEHQTMSFVVNYGWTLLAHELAHQWFGDLVTCGSWEDIWLNEGFATYLEALTKERFQSASAWRSWKAGSINSIASQPGGAVKVSDTTSVNRIFSGRLSYTKGAYLLHMLRWKLGEENFFQGLRNYLGEYQYGYAKTPDLQAHLEAISGLDLAEFFNDWFAGQGYPSYSVIWEQEGNNLLIELSQTTSHGSVDFFEMPVPVVLHGFAKDTVLRLDNTYNNQLFVIPVSYDIVSVDFDPDLWILSKNNLVQPGDLSSVTHQLSNGARASIYPNPVQEMLGVSLESSVPIDVHWQIFNVLGQRLQSGNMDDSGISIHVSHFEAGIYQLTLTDNAGGMAVLPFVKR